MKQNASQKPEPTPSPPPSPILERRRLVAIGDYLRAMPNEPKSHWEMFTSMMHDLGDLRDKLRRRKTAKTLAVTPRTP